jgi:hypothetical protein
VNLAYYIMGGDRDGEPTFSCALRLRTAPKNNVWNCLDLPTSDINYIFVGYSLENAIFVIITQS